MLKHLYRAGDAVEIDPGVKRDRGTVQTLIGLQLTITETKLLPNRLRAPEGHPQWVKVKKPDGDVTDWLSGDWFRPVKSS